MDYVKIHDEETFKKLHAANWLYMEQEQIIQGKMEDIVIAPESKFTKRSEEIADELVKIGKTKANLTTVTGIE